MKTQTVCCASSNLAGRQSERESKPTYPNGTPLSLDAIVARLKTGAKRIWTTAAPASPKMVERKRLFRYCPIPPMPMH